MDTSMSSNDWLSVIERRRARGGALHPLTADGFVEAHPFRSTFRGMVNGLSERAVGQNGLIAGLFHESRWHRHQPRHPLGLNRLTPRETTDRSQALRFGVIPTSHDIWTIVETPLAHARSYQKSKTQMTLVYYALMLRRRGRRRACSRSWVVGPGNLPEGRRLLVGDSGRGKSGK
jgi:hypothetical protein